VDVLLVHCDPAFVSSVTNVLRRHRFSVFAAGSAKDAMETVTQGCIPRLVLLDASHPGLDARRLLGRLRSEPACDETRFAILTRASDGAAFGGLPVDDTLLKPLEVGELLEVLRRQCGPA
jgi:DNA-binding response OmpR family regulator